MSPGGEAEVRAGRAAPLPFTAADFAATAPSVDYFSLMTYDYSRARAGPSAPLAWIRATVEAIVPEREHRAKILLGLNFYGMDFAAGRAGEAVLGPRYISLLKAHKPRIVYEEVSGEHSFMYTARDGADHTVFYPTLHSIAERVSLARELGTGISIWELGQGLDYFFDLF